MPSVAARTFSFQPKLLGDRASASVEISSPDAKALIDALLDSGGTIPPGEITLGGITASVDGGSDVTFSGGKVTFTGHAGAAFGMGVYVDAADAIKAIAPSPELIEGLKLTDPAATRYVVLRAAFDASATARGSIALAAGAGASFGVEGSTRRLFAVLHRFHDTDKAVDVFNATFDSWTLPRNIEAAGALAPETWVLAEVDGTFALQLGARVGYDFSWLRQIPGGALKGDIGLRVELGASAALGFEASGKYLVIVGREAAASDHADSQKLRVRLHKLSKKGWTFALDARVGVQSALPGFFDRGHKPEALVAAIFGLNENQIIGAIGKTREFVNPNVSLQDRLAGLIVHLGGKAVDEVTGLSPAEIETIYETGRLRLVGLLERVDRLDTNGGHEITSVLLSLSRTDIAEVSDSLKSLANAGGDALAQQAIRQLVSRVGFERTPIGRLIETAAGSALAAVDDIHQARKIRGIGADILAVLEGDTLQQLLDFIRSKVHIDLLKDGLDQASFDRLDNLLKDRIASFLGKQPVVKDLDEIRSAIHAVMKKADDFYAAALAAVKQQQEFAFAATYARTTTKTALIDATFDFSTAGVDAKFKRVIAGDFGDLILNAVDGVKLDVATLSHGIKRNVATELTMPFGKMSTVMATRADASLKVVEDNGRVLVYELDGGTTVKERSAIFRARHGRNSALTIAATLPLAIGGDVRVWNPQVFTYAYRMERAVRKMRASQLIEECQPLIDRYVPGAFGSAEARTFGEWVADLDKSLDGKDPNSGTHDIGDTLIGLTLTAPPAFLAAWTQAPLDRHDALYKTLSLAVQRRLKELVTFYRFSDPAEYGSPQAAAPAIVFSSMRPTTNVDIDLAGNVRFDAGSDLYWDHRNLKEVRAVITSPPTLAALTHRMSSIAGTLRGIPDLARTAQFYAPQMRARVIDDALDVLHNGSPVPEFLGSLLSLEAQLIDSAVRSALAIAAFRAVAGTNPEKALEHLAEFGERLSRTFNDAIGSHPLLSGAARPLASLLFVEASAIFDPSLAGQRLAALMEIAVVKSGQVTIDQMLAGELKDELILHSQRFVEA